MQRDRGGIYLRSGVAYNWSHFVLTQLYYTTPSQQPLYSSSREIYVANFACNGNVCKSSVFPAIELNAPPDHNWMVMTGLVLYPAITSSLQLSWLCFWRSDYCTATVHALALFLWTQSRHFPEPSSLPPRSLIEWLMVAGWQLNWRSIIIGNERWKVLEISWYGYDDEDDDVRSLARGTFKWKSP